MCGKPDIQGPTRKCNFCNRRRVLVETEYHCPYCWGNPRPKWGPFVNFKPPEDEIGPPLPLLPHDTLLLAIDGLTDNLHTQEIVDRIRAGPLAGVLGEVVAACADRMCNPSEGAPSKPDDLACILFRLTASKSDAAAITTSRDPQCERPEC